MPSGEKLTIQMPAVVAAFEDYPGINEMIARQWAVNIGVHGEVQSLERTLESATAGTLNELMLYQLGVFTTIDHADHPGTHLLTGCRRWKHRQALR